MSGFKPAFSQASFPTFSIVSSFERSKAGKCGVTRNSAEAIPSYFLLKSSTIFWIFAINSFSVSTSELLMEYLARAWVFMRFVIDFSLM